MKRTTIILTALLTLAQLYGKGGPSERDTDIKEPIIYRLPPEMEKVFKKAITEETGPRGILINVYSIYRYNKEDVMTFDITDPYDDIWGKSNRFILINGMLCPVAFNTDESFFSPSGRAYDGLIKRVYYLIEGLYIKTELERDSVFDYGNRFDYE